MKISHIPFQCKSIPTLEPFLILLPTKLQRVFVPAKNLAAGFPNKFVSNGTAVREPMILGCENMVRVNKIQSIFGLRQSQPFGSNFREVVSWKHVFGCTRVDGDAVSASMSPSSSFSLTGRHKPGVTIDRKDDCVGAHP